MASLRQATPPESAPAAVVFGEESQKNAHVPPGEDRITTPEIVATLKESLTTRR